VPIPSQVNALRNAIDSGVITTKEFEVVTKPEETDEFIRIPVDSGNHEGHRIRTIDISKDEGIKALYCGTDKVVMTYLFLKAKGWTMTKAKAWVKEHENKSLEVEHEISQEEIIDEIDYLKSLIEKEGLSEDAKTSATELIKIMCSDDLIRELAKRLSGNDIPVKDMAVKLEISDLPEVKETLNQATRIIDDEKIRLIVEQTIKNVVKNS